MVDAPERLTASRTGAAVVRRVADLDAEVRGWIARAYEDAA